MADATPRSGSGKGAGTQRYGLGAGAYTSTADQWALFRKALGNEKQRHGAELRRSLLSLRRGLGRSSLRIIDVGSADGELTSYYADLSRRPILVDISSKLMQQAMARPELKHAKPVVQDIQKLLGAGRRGRQFRRNLKGKVDAIVMSNILFAVRDQVGTVHKAAKLLRPGGKVFIVVTDANCECEQFRRQFVKATGLNGKTNLPHTKLIAGLKKRGYKVTYRTSPGTFRASVEDTIAMGPIHADTTPEQLAKHPTALKVLERMARSHAKNGRVELDNPTVFIEVRR